jgi:hypothetical protein
MTWSRTVILLLVLISCALFAGETHAAILQSKVVDAETNEPLEGTVVVVVWRRPVFSLCMDSCSTFHDAVETVTDAEGNFAVDISMGLLANDRKITIYKPGYYLPNSTAFPWLFSESAPPPNESRVIRLIKAPSLLAESKGYAYSFMVCSPNESTRFCVPPSKVKRYIQLRELVARIQDPPFFPQEPSQLPQLHAATVMGNLDKVRFLLHQGADPDGPDQYGRTALMLITRTIFSNRTQVRAWAERHGGPPEMKKDVTKTYDDVRTRSEAIFRALLAAGANPNAKAKNGDTAIMLAIPPRRLIVGTRGSRYRDLDLMRVHSPDLVIDLLANGANPNIQNNEGATSLIFAASRGLEKIVKALLAHGADVNLKAHFRLTAYDLAEGDEVIRALRDARRPKK